MPSDMKQDWNDRARANARFYIASADGDQGDAFVASGHRDVALFFQGIESLLGPDTTVLDIGCGIGRMDEHIVPGVGKLIGLDVSGEMVAQARERLQHLENLEFVEGDGWKLDPIADGSIDLAFSHIAFQHMPRAVAASYFAEAHRVLRVGGHFVFQVPETNADAPADPPDSDTFEMRFYAVEELRKQLEAIGFQWVGVLRHPVQSEQLDFNQLRIHVTRT